MEGRQIENKQDAQCEHIFENDSYAKTFETQVLACEQIEEKNLWRCVLAKTAFFPEGGGQNADRGTLNGIEVVDVQLQGDTVWHYTKAPMTVGETVHGEIDWQRRFDYMQQHSGEHIISGIIYSRYGYHNVGFHLGDDIVTLDLDGVLNAGQLLEVEAKANRAVILNKAITVSYPSKEELAQIDYRSKIEIDGQVRLVTIKDYDICACCAPHVARTGEIGLIKILSSQNYKGGVRLSMVCGFRALKDYRMKQENVGNIGALLSVRPYETYEAVRKMHEELQQVKYQLNAVKEQLILQRIQSDAEKNSHAQHWYEKVSVNADMAACENETVSVNTDMAACKNETEICQENMNPNRISVSYFDTQLDAVLIKRIMPVLTEKYPGYCCLFAGNDAGGYQYWVGTAHGDARKVGELLKAHFTCRGGGRPELIQGKITGAQADIETVLKNFKEL